MTDIQMSLPGVDEPARLTTDNAASSYGIPVLVVGESGGAYGPGDLLMGRTVSELVYEWARRNARDLSEAHVRSVRSYLSQRSDGPQIETGYLMRRRRLRLGLTQAAAAERTDMSQGRWGDIEHDKGSPTVTTLERVATVLECGVRDLV